MSVIWSGVTEEGAVVPVQVTAEGKVVAVGDGPEGDYLKLTGGNLTGDLTVNEQIKLATDGSAEFSGGDISLNADGSAAFANGNYTTNINSNRLFFGVYGNAPGNLGGAGIRTIYQDSFTYFSFNKSEGANEAFLKFASGPSVSAGTTDKFIVNNTGALHIGTAISSNNGAGSKISLNPDGSATFAGDVVIGSRGEKWLIRESNGVAMLVQQTLLKQPREIEKLRDLPNELDLIEAALNEIMDKLRMTPPAGWPVWDGQSEATTDNDNA